MSALGKAFAADATEIVIRVGQYGADLRTQERFHAIVRFRDGTQPTRAGLGRTPQEALEAAVVMLDPEIADLLA